MPKKISVQNFRNPQTSSMSPPRPYTVSTSMRPGSSIEDDDDDDICPVCESECTCHNRSNTVSAGRSAVPMLISTSTSTASSHPKRPPGRSGDQLHSLKIKLTVPPNLKLRKDGHATQKGGGLAESSKLALSAIRSVDAVAPKRRGRPTKAVIAAREAARAALAANYVTMNEQPRLPPLKNSFSLSSATIARSRALKQKSHPTVANARTRSRGKGAAALDIASSLSTLTDSDEESHFPTFVSAASTSSLTSSSESSDDDSDSVSSDSDPANEELFLVQSGRDKARLKRELLGDDSSQKRRDHAPSDRWEIKPRKKSVGAGDSDSQSGSGESSDEEEEADDEDDGEDDEEDGMMNDAGVFADTDMSREVDDFDGKLGVSFHGVPSGWSEDEESSFDAELFFANLDDSSDSCSSPAALRNDESTSDLTSEVDAFSADEEDALLLMNVDSSAQIRRTPGEFEIGVDLDGLSFGLDGHLLPSPFGPFDAEASFDGSTESDVDMTVSESGVISDDESDELALVETDGETTEDELVDSDGLPNSRAMMLFRWPSTVSTVDPSSTMSPSAIAAAARPTPAHASRTTCIALASMSRQHNPPAPTPADILAGKISMDDLDDVEITSEGRSDTRKSSASNSSIPLMGQFIADPTADPHAIIDGSGTFAPSPFPRSRILRAKRRKTLLHRSTSTVGLSTDVDADPFYSSQPQISVAVPSSDEVRSQVRVPSSDEPSSTDVIDLDDVLDASLLDSEPAAFDSDDASQDPCTPRTPASSGPHIKNLTRWDRIPVATFRRTREIPQIEDTPVSDKGVSGRFPNMGTLVSNDMLATPKPTGKSRKLANVTPGKRSKGKTPMNLLVISPVLLPVRDGDRTPTNAGSSAYNLFHDPLHQQKSRRDQRREKAMLKKKMMGKYSSAPTRQKHHLHRPHYPNTKSRGSNSMQRTQFFASSSHVPHLNL